MTARANQKKLTRRRRRLRYAARKTAWAVIIVAVLAGLVIADRLGIFGWATPPDKDKYDGKSFVVINVVDGDTLDIGTPDAVAGRPFTRIRLWGVDTPEVVKPETPPQHFGQQASEFTKSTCAGQTVTLELEPLKTRDKYGRLLAYVILPSGEMLNSLLIERGFGYADTRFRHSRMSLFKRLQRQAKAAGEGLWKDVRNSDLPDYHRDRLKLPDDSPRSRTNSQ